MTKVCRLCLMKLQRGSKYFNINAVESFTGFMPYRDQLTTCIPEMALDLIPNPVICNNCRTALKSSYDFKSRCLLVEKKIRSYVATLPSNASNYNLAEIDTTSLPKAAKFEPEVTKEPPKLVPILPKVEVQRVHSQPPSILSNLLTVKEEVILPHPSEIEITNIGFTSTPARGRGPKRAISRAVVPCSPIEQDEHGLYTCNHCDKKFPNVPSLHTHKTRVHEEDYLCNFCNVPFKTLQNLRKHNQQCQKIRTTPPTASTNSVLTKRPHLPTKAKNHLKRWLFNHTDHPYPTDVEKQQLMKETNLSLLQVENWFINARRRILADLTKLKNMRGGGGGGGSRGRGGYRGRGRGRGRVEADRYSEDFLDETDTFLEEQEESKNATRLLRELEEQEMGGEVEEIEMEADVGSEEGVETSFEMPEEFLEERQEEEQDEEEEEEIAADSLEKPMEDPVDKNLTNESPENTDDEEHDPLEDVPLSTLSSNIKMEVEIEER